MKPMIKTTLLAACALAAIFQLLAATQVYAHGSGWSQEEPYTVTISFYYADQTTMAYSEVQIFAPGEEKIPYQKGRSDKNGYFAFKPDSTGLWSFSADDGQGHFSKGSVEITAKQITESVADIQKMPSVTSEAATAPAPPLTKGGASAEGPDPLKIILGISLLANLGFIGLWLKALKRKK